MHSVANWRWLAAAAAVALVERPLGSQQPNRVTASTEWTVRASPPRGAVHVDGKLDEAAWQLADSIGSLTQIEPVEGAVPRGRTVIRILVDTRVIVFGIRADDPEPDRIVSFARARDADLEDEDHVRLVLDTYLDGRSGYVFAVNPNGARYDALITEQGDEEDSNWDAVWEAASVRTPTGWSAEIRIPLKSLLFGRGLESWGFNVQRRVQRSQETDRWASPERDYQVTQTSRAGRLVGLPPFELGVGFSVRPSITAGAERAQPGASTDAHRAASLDVTQRLGANTLASLTVNTDFAETEVDTRRTNLTRFPISFPEKRTFFLEGSDIFAFALAGDEVRPFFSRRIGLAASRAIPIDVGGKVNGRLGGTNFGALLVRTARVDTLPTDNTLGVLRIKQNVLGESSVGLIATAGDPVGRDRSWLTGTDLIFQTSRFRGDKNLVVGAWGLVTGREDLAGRRGAYGGRIDYPNDLLEMSATYRWVGDGFQPSLGFVPRPGVQQINLSLNYQPRPSRPVAGLHVRQMQHEFEPSLVMDMEGAWESYRVFTAPVNWQLESGDRVELNWAPAGERLREPFEIADGIEIPAGRYHWNRFRAEAELASKRKFSGQLTWWFGGFYTGRLHELELEASWKPSALINLDLTAERNVGHLREGSFSQDLVGGRLRVNISPDLQVNSFVQYDNESDSFGTNTRLRWSFSPLGDLFVVYNHNASTFDPISRSRRFAFESNQLLVKAQYALRY